ncbi:Hypothetical protein HVPorG_03245 [Roseomonas mucosa]|uniref:hypothetical protein n=2 Tax=Roseomonas TaxID=125216 RepID=UPI00096A022A|nr:MULTISPECIES: hypothetical protein [Roseomonas]ATR20559.1 hypothetical protein CTJ15_09760 [Roseomonas sp. FDAARGOS_362]MDT8263239.1 hypothetical protein [Roseomonas sp. DSM 102946]MDT8277689.1 hypothetical protein [Roseomonas mucosa]QDJ09871.1 Hypothetical protein HVPorG_03245 [Roseomonas mucosa]USQ71377.1 hypothetical protein NF552_18380 [Roseomonas mucosa]
MMLRALRLVGMAAQAESRRLKVQAGSKINQLLYWLIAAVFGCAAFVMLHILIYNFAFFHAGAVGAAAILLAMDLVVALVLALLASRGGHSNAEIEARAVRDVALSGAAEEVFLGVARKSAPIAVLGGILLTLLRRR